MIFADRSKAVLLLWNRLVFLFIFVLLSCPILSALWPHDFLAISCVVFSCVCVTFPYGVPSQVWYLIVSIPDLCLPFYLDHRFCCSVLEMQISRISTRIERLTV